MEQNCQLIHSNEAHLIEAEKICHATEKVVEILEMAAGSTVGFDLYKVMDAYIRNLDKRHRINKLLGISEDGSYYEEEMIEQEIEKEKAG